MSSSSCPQHLTPSSGANERPAQDAAEEIAASFTAMTLLQFVTERPCLHAIMLDGVQASVENMQAGKYTLRTNMQLITSGNRPRWLAALLRSPALHKPSNSFVKTGACRYPHRARRCSNVPRRFLIHGEPGCKVDEADPLIFNRLSTRLT